MKSNLTIADGQLAATATAITAGPSDDACPVNLVLTNVGGQPETVVLTVARNGGTQRRVARFVLQDNEQAYVMGLPLNSSDTLYGATSNASSVDYVASKTEKATPFSVYSLDANGALKSGAAAIGSGSLTITGDLSVQGGDIDAGASGAAGSVDVFPSTAAKGKLAITVSDQAGNTTVGLNVAQMAAARTITLPDPLAAADILLGQQAAVARTATADGLTTGTIAAAGKFQHITVTSVDANHIIVLPTPTPGTIIVLDVGANGFELRSSDPTTIAINGGTGADAESAIAANSTCVMICVSATAWKGFFLDADSDVAKVEAAA